MVSELCVAAVASDAKRLWTLFQTDEAHMLIAALAFLRALLFLLLAIPMREAQELACTIMVIALILLLIAVGRVDLLAKSQIVALCGERETIVATTTGPQAHRG